MNLLLLCLVGIAAAAPAHPLKTIPKTLERREALAQRWGTEARKTLMETLTDQNIHLQTKLDALEKHFSNMGHDEYVDQEKSSLGIIANLSDLLHTQLKDVPKMTTEKIWRLFNAIFRLDQIMQDPESAGSKVRQEVKTLTDEDIQHLEQAADGFENSVAKLLIGMDTDGQKEE